MILSTGNQTLELLPQRALHWHEQRTLILADVHLGKTAAFRSHGLPVPEGGTFDDLEKISALLACTGAHRLIVVGDLFHAGCGVTPVIRECISAWREQWSALAIVLVPGNHDASVRSLPAEWKLERAARRMREAPFHFIHDPADHEPAHGFGVCGHLHPAVRIGDSGMRGFSAPCFWLGLNRLVLPAFGSFTGSRAVRPDGTDRLIAVTGGRFLEVPAAMAG